MGSSTSQIGPLQVIPVVFPSTHSTLLSGIVSRMFPQVLLQMKTILPTSLEWDWASRSKSFEIPGFPVGCQVVFRLQRFRDWANFRTRSLEPIFISTQLSALPLARQRFFFFLIFKRLPDLIQSWFPTSTSLPICISQWFFTEWICSPNIRMLRSHHTHQDPIFISHKRQCFEVYTRDALCFWLHPDLLQPPVLWLTCQRLLTERSIILISNRIRETLDLIQSLSKGTQTHTHTHTHTQRQSRQR